MPLEGREGGYPGMLRYCFLHMEGYARGLRNGEGVSQILQNWRFTASERRQTLSVPWKVVTKRDDNKTIQHKQEPFNI